MYLYLGGNGAVVAVSPETGREVWRTPLYKKRFFTLSSDFTVRVLDHEDLVFALSRGRLFALDAATGGVLWQFDLVDSVGRSGVTLSISGKSIQQITGSSSEVISVLMTGS
jgi:outer membrane protein assembly factor BamB